MKVIVKARSKRAANKILLDKYNKGWHVLVYCNFKELSTVEETKLLDIVNSLNKHAEFNTTYIYLKQGD
jgi:hypothetical protein